MDRWYFRFPDSVELEFPIRRLKFEMVVNSIPEFNYWQRIGGNVPTTVWYFSVGLNRHQVKWWNRHFWGHMEEDSGDSAMMANNSGDPKHITGIPSDASLLQPPTFSRSISAPNAREEDGARHLNRYYCQSIRRKWDIHGSIGVNIPHIGYM